ncbi:MAG TPA: hypothetical protein VMZ91_06650 [Candidatus Paceibacterota bacterium]|nr:hypothetical protein [Candidatus Paceibacterota bacterium]
MAKIGEVFKDIFNEYVDIKPFQDTKQMLIDRKAKAGEEALNLDNEVKKIDVTIANIMKANAEEKKTEVEKQKMDLVTKKSTEDAAKQKQIEDKQGVGTVVKTAQ